MLATWTIGNFLAINQALHPGLVLALGRRSVTLMAGLATICLSCASTWARPGAWEQEQILLAGENLCDLIISAIRWVGSSRFRRVQFYTDNDRVRCNLLLMARDINIVRIEKDGPDGIIVTFSDGTFGAYVVEELLALRPHREQVQVESIPSAKEKGIAVVPRSLDQVLQSHGIPRHRGK
jgi:hypothetical protein